MAHQSSVLNAKETSTQLCNLPSKTSADPPSDGSSQNTLTTSSRVSEFHECDVPVDLTKDDLPTAHSDTALDAGITVFDTDIVQKATILTGIPGAGLLTENTKPTGSQPSFSSTEPNDYIYHVKWVGFRGDNRPVVTQNENGPCPIIAIANVLSLRGNLMLSEGTELLTGQRLVSLLSDILLSQPVTSLDDEHLLNYETTVSDAFNLFPSLQTGLDINVRFTSVSSFEFTPALGVFDLFKIPLYHGWLVDPSDLDLASVVGDRTYNQLVERIIKLRASTDPAHVAQGLLAEDFLDQAASQLTYHGLCELSTTVTDGQLAVFFRNNHFSAIYKNQGRIYVLVTDMGLLNEPNIVWEVLNDVDGDTQFVDSSFKLYSPTVSSETTNVVLTPTPESSNEESKVTIVDSENTTTAVSVADSTELLNYTSTASPKIATCVDPHVPSIDALARACSDRLKMSSGSSEQIRVDLDMAARLQLAEIASSRRTISVVPAKDGNSDHSVPHSDDTERKTRVPSDKLSHICSKQLLAQAQKELGSGSDLDVAVHLQWAELERANADSEHSVPGRATGSTARGPGNCSSPAADRGATRSAGSVPSRRAPSDSDRSNCRLI